MKLTNKEINKYFPRETKDIIYCINNKILTSEKEIKKMKLKEIKYIEKLNKKYKRDFLEIICGNKNYFFINKKNGNKCFFIKNKNKELFEGIYPDNTDLQNGFVSNTDCDWIFYLKKEDGCFTVNLKEEGIIKVSDTGNIIPIKQNKNYVIFDIIDK